MKAKKIKKDLAVLIVVLMCIGSSFFLPGKITGNATTPSVSASILEKLAVEVTAFNYYRVINRTTPQNISVEITDTGSTEYDARIGETIYTLVGNSTLNMTAAYTDSLVHLFPSNKRYHQLLFIPPDLGTYYIKVSVHYGPRLTEVWGTFQVVETTDTGGFSIGGGGSGAGGGSGEGFGGSGSGGGGSSGAGTGGSGAGGGSGGGAGTGAGGGSSGAGAGSSGGSGGTGSSGAGGGGSGSGGTGTGGGGIGGGTGGTGQGAGQGTGPGAGGGGSGGTGTGGGEGQQGLLNQFPVSTDITLNYSDPVIVYRNISALIPVIVKNTGKYNIERLSMFTSMPSTFESDLNPKGEQILGRNSSLIYLLSVNSGETEIGNYTVAVQVTSYFTKKEGSFTVEVQEVPQSLKDLILSKVLNYEFLIAEVGGEIETAEIHGYNVATPRRFLNAADEDLNQTKIYYNFGQYDDAIHQLDRVEGELKQAVFTLGNITLGVYPQPGLNYYYILVFIIGVLALLFIFYRRTTRNKRPKLLVKSKEED